MDFEFIVSTLLPILTSLGVAIGWLYDKKKRKAELQGLIVQNEQSEASLFKSMQESYTILKVEMDDTVRRLLEDNKILKENMEILENRLEESKQERIKLTEQVERFKSQSKEDAKIITALKSRIERYEKDIMAIKRQRAK